MPEDLVRQVQEAYTTAGGYARGWGCDPRWVSAMVTVAARCAAAGWSATTYVEAQLEVLLPFCKERGARLAPGMFVGEAAMARFRVWAERQRLRTGSAADGLRSAEDPLMAGEREFATRYLRSPGLSARQVEAEVAAHHPGWSLDATTSRRDLRLQALAAAAASVDPTAPDRLLAPADGLPLGWPEARRAVLAAFGRGAEV